MNEKEKSILIEHYYKSAMAFLNTLVDCMEYSTYKDTSVKELKLVSDELIQIINRIEEIQKNEGG